MEQPRPDDKDWTWVLERPCPECGLDPGSIEATTIGARLRPIVSEWYEVLGAGEAVRRRPPPGPDGAVIWSPLEYGCHVRDVFTLFAERLALMLGRDDPLFQNWDQDATAIELRYWEQDPMVVRDELRAAGERLADAFDAVRDDQWQRTGKRSDGAVFSVASFGRYFLHDPYHHLWDVRT